jgi:hypothetical protein
MRLAQIVATALVLAFGGVGDGRAQDSSYIKVPNADP